MPIYEYSCQKCNTKFEKLVRSMCGGKDIACPSCGSKKVQREMSVFSVNGEPAARPARPAGCGGCCGANSCPMAE